MRFKDLTGQVFGRLTVLEVAFRKSGKQYWLCRCECGKELATRGTSLVLGIARSCGCLKIDMLASQAKTHGHSGQGPSPTYITWRGMKTRCNNPKHRRYSDYGGRGIKVCERWMDFNNFLADMGERPEGLTLDRIDPNGNYEPGNCRWATDSVQQTNKRKKKK